MLGPYSWDVSDLPLVMGVLNRTPDSFYDKGAYFPMDRFLRRAEQVVAEGADLVDIGGVKAGPGDPVSVQEEMDRVVPAVELLTDRFGAVVSVDTWRSEVAEQAFVAGAVLGNDISGLSDARYAAVAAAAGAGVVVTHIRLGPRVPDPDPVYADLVGEVEQFLLDRAAAAVAAGVRSDSILLDAGLDLGKTPEQSLRLLDATARLALHGHPVLLSASHKRFLGWACSIDDVAERGAASLAAAALGAWTGARVIRSHDVKGTKEVCSTVAAVLGYRRSDR
ncbi:MAG: dihydropteroate synthase [Actinomycetota bacterium]|nr:dihydropteroate synthase [Actinomycetota bacterium]